MQAKIIRDDVEVNLSATPAEYAGRYEFREVMRSGELVQRPFWKVGAVIEHPQSFRLVQQGCAVAADEECAKRANRSPQQIEAAQHAYERLNKGIHPEDFDKFDAGMILGYQPDGSYIPGPNFHLLQAEEDDDE